MPNELMAVSNEELMALTGESGQGFGAKVKFIKLQQKHSPEVLDLIEKLTKSSAAARPGIQKDLDAALAKEVPVGNYVISDGKGEDGRTVWKDLGNPFIGQILRVRTMWATKMGVTPPLRTNEVDSVNDPITVTDTELMQELKTTACELMKAEYPQLKMNQVLYVWSEEMQVACKLVVKGGSIGNWFNYCGSFPRNVSKSTVETVFGSAESEDPNGNKYYAMTFSKGEPVRDMAKTVQLLNALNSVIGAPGAAKPMREIVPPADPLMDAMKSELGAAPAAEAPKRLPRTQPTMRERRAMISEASEAAQKRASVPPAEKPPAFLDPDVDDTLK